MEASRLATIAAGALRCGTAEGRHNAVAFLMRAQQRLLDATEAAVLQAAADQAVAS